MWPAHAKELTPNKPDKWWFKRDSAFLNQETLGFHFGCKCNHPATKETAASANKNKAPV